MYYYNINLGIGLYFVQAVVSNIKVVYGVRLKSLHCMQCRICMKLYWARYATWLTAIIADFIELDDYFRPFPPQFFHTQAYRSYSNIWSILTISVVYIFIRRQCQRQQLFMLVTILLAIGLPFRCTIQLIIHVNLFFILSYTMHMHGCRLYHFGLPKVLNVIIIVLCALLKFLVIQIGQSMVNIIRVSCSPTRNW